MSETFYRKRGRRYIPVAEYDDHFSHAFPQGHSLVYCQPGERLTIHGINPDRAACLAALAECRDEVARYVMSATQRPHSPMDIVRTMEEAILRRVKP